MLSGEIDRKLCRTCGEDITEHTRHQRWTECSFCYWKRRLETSPTLESLIKQRNELRLRQKQLNAALEPVLAQIKVRENLLKANSRWWKKLLGIELADRQLKELGMRVSGLRGSSHSVCRELKRVESSIESAKHIRKRFQSAAQQAAFKREREQAAQQQKFRFAEESDRAASDSYERSLFELRKQDYKRGNLLDNHFRSRLLDQAFDAFDSKCLFCGGTHDLTLDHFGLPKNEGGNFVLLLQHGSGIRMNIVVLCRSCNASKGERAYDEFFDEAKVREAAVRQKRLLDLVLSDAETVAIVRSWYGVRLGRSR